MLVVHLFSIIPALCQEATNFSEKPVMLQGGVEESEIAPLQSAEPILGDFTKPPVSFNASQPTGLLNSSVTEPGEESEYKIDWTRWRNKVGRTIWSKFNRKLIGNDAIFIGLLYLKFSDSKAPAHSFPVGIRAIYVCDVDSARHISNLRITESSGDSRYDQLVLDSVMELEGKRVLTFPLGTKREVVSISHEFKIGKRIYRESTLDDTESVRY